MPAPPTVVWFRRDLRVADHPALSSAAARGPVVCLWVCDPALLARRHHHAPLRLAFLRDGLTALDGELRARGGALAIRIGDPAHVVPELAREVGADTVAWTREISPWGRARDAAVRTALDAAGVATHEHDGDLVARLDDIPGPAGEGYRVFAPFFRHWCALPVPAHIPAPRQLEGRPVASAHPDMLGSIASPIAAGPGAARGALVAFITGGSADAYADERDALARDATSHLSAYLRFGMCTGAQVGRALGLPGVLSAGRQAFWRQIGWREFYHHHLARNPDVARMAWRTPLRAITWEDDPDGLAAWCAGRTGYPLVDAGMRQLAASGWMHNRARMVCASFLVKDLLIDWRRGERVFMQRLVDGDPASNNGGWQWTAGTGTDAAPYYRIFNPVLQSRRFDPSGEYVRRWVPELRHVPDRWIHEPWRMTDAEQRQAGCVVGSDYPSPIVDHNAQRGRAMEHYRAAEALDPDGAR